MITVNKRDDIIPKITTPVLSVLELFIISKPSPTAILRSHNSIIKTGSVVNAMICFLELSK